LKFNTRSPLEDTKRAIQRRKFYATLPGKLDRAQEEWHKAQPPAMPPPVRLGDLHIKAPFTER